MSTVEEQIEREIGTFAMDLCKDLYATFGRYVSFSYRISPSKYAEMTWHLEVFPDAQIRAKTRIYSGEIIIQNNPAGDYQTGMPMQMENPIEITSSYVIVLLKLQGYERYTAVYFEPQPEAPEPVINRLNRWQHLESQGEDLG